MVSNLDSADPLADVNRGTRHVIAGTRQLFRQFGQQASGIADTFVDRNIAILYSCFAAAIIYMLAALLFVFAAINFLVVEFEFKYWTAALATCIILFSLPFIAYPVFKIICRLGKKRQLLEVPLSLDSLSSGQIEKGVREMTQGISRIFSFKSIVSRNPQAAMISAGLAGLVAGQIIVPAKKRLDTISLSNATKYRSPDELRKAVAENAATKNKEQSAGLIETMIGYAVPYVISALHKKLSTHIKESLSPAEREPVARHMNTKVDDHSSHMHMQ